MEYVCEVGSEVGSAVRRSEVGVKYVGSEVYVGVKKGVK